MTNQVQEALMTQEESTTELVARAEINQQIATAKQNPRDVLKFRDKVLKLSTMNDDVANECIYAIPRSGKMIEGPSVRFAEIVASCWGNCRAGARVTHEDENFVVAQGVVHDLETNSAITFEVRRRITDRYGKRYGDDMIGVTSSAACAIALRNAVLRGIPKAFWADIYDETRRTAIGDAETLATRRAKAMDFLKKLGATEDQIIGLFGYRSVEEIGPEDLVQLRGVASAIKEGETTVEQAFADDRRAKTDTGKAKTVADVVGDKPAEEKPPETTAEDPGESPQYPDGADGTEDDDGLDKDGVPWNDEYHSSNHRKGGNGRWMLRRFRDAAAREKNHIERAEWMEAYKAGPQQEQDEAPPETEEEESGGATEPDTGYDFSGWSVEQFDQALDQAGDESNLEAVYALHNALAGDDTSHLDDDKRRALLGYAKATIVDLEAT